MTSYACFHGAKPIDTPNAAKLVFDTDPQAVRVQMIRQPSAPLTVDWSMQIVLPSPTLTASVDPRVMQVV